MMAAIEAMTRYRLVAAITLIAFATILLFYRLDALSFSVDEFVNAEIDLQPFSHIWIALQKGTDLHPPLTHWLSHIWSQLFGRSEWGLRSLWAFTGVLTVALTYRVGAALGNRRAGLLGTLLLVTSPTFILYSRFVKYYALTMLLAVTVTWAFHRFRESLADKHLLIYLISMAVFLYTDYFGPMLFLIWQDLFAVMQFLRHRKSSNKVFLRRILLAQGIAGLLWAPWLSTACSQAKQVAVLQEADIGEGFFAFVLKVIYAHYSFGLGETIFPWNPLAIGGMIWFLIIWIGSLWALIFRRSNSFTVWTGSFSLLSIGLVAGLTSSLITGVPFIAFANHILFSLPLFVLWLAAGALTIRWRIARWLIVGLLFISRIAGLGNYFAAREFHNPIYVVPTRDIVAQLAREVRSGDVVLAEGDIGIDFYASRTPGWNIPVWNASDAQLIRQRIESSRPSRIWFFVFGRDRTRGVTPTVLQEFVATRCKLSETRGYVEQDSPYRAIKEWLFRRPAYRYKLTLYLYNCH